MKVQNKEPITYKDLADKISRYHFNITSRKLSEILNRCPILFYIPTHRVIRSNGQTGSFSNDVKLKKMLLDIEKNNSYSNIPDIVLVGNDFINSMAELLKLYDSE